MNIIARRLAAVAGAAVLGLSIAAPAQAQKWSRVDARGDVTVSTNCDASGCTDSVDPALAEPDVLRVVGTHAPRKVKVFATYADLTAANGRLHILRVVTNEGVRRRVELGTEDGRVVTKGLYADRTGRKVACAGLGHKVDYAANTVSLSIPRGCLSKPRWVRIGFGTLAEHVADATGSYADDAILSGVTPSTRDFVLSPRIRRG